MEKQHCLNCAHNSCGITFTAFEKMGFCTLLQIEYYTDGENCYLDRFRNEEIESCNYYEKEM